MAGLLDMFANCLVEEDSRRLKEQVVDRMRASVVCLGKHLVYRRPGRVEGWKRGKASTG